MQYWLMKSEPSCFSIEDLQKVKHSPWDGVRNYQARNFMRDQMQIGDLVLFYHSNAKPPGIAGIAKICSKPYPDHTQFDPNSQYFDSKSTKENPIWMLVDVAFVKKFRNLVPLDYLKTIPELKEMLVLKKGMRLSIQPVEKKHFERIKDLSIAIKKINCLN